MIKHGLLSKGAKRVGNAKGRSELGRGRTKHKHQNEREIRDDGDGQTDWNEIEEKD